MKKLTALLMALLLVVLGAATALAADGNVSYSGNAGQFIFEPGSEYSPTDLFPDLKSVMPGDSITQRITVTNRASQAVDVKIHLRALGAHRDSEEFLSQLTLTVTQVGQGELFNAPADRTAQLTDWVCLGEVQSGGTVELAVTLTVPTTMGNEFADRAGYLDWQFMVEEFPATDSPQTGDEMNLGLYIGLMAAALVAIVVIVLLLIRRRRKEEE